MSCQGKIDAEDVMVGDLIDGRYEVTDVRTERNGDVRVLVKMPPSGHVRPCCFTPHAVLWVK